MKVKGTYNEEIVCDFCNSPSPASAVKKNDREQYVCETCLKGGLVKICSECGVFAYTEEMHFHPGIYKPVCPECFYGPYGEPKTECGGEDPTLYSNIKEE